MQLIRRPMPSIVRLAFGPSCPETDFSIPQTPFLAAASPAAARDNVSEEAESLGNGLREPTAEEMQKLREHPFVKQVNDLFSTDVIFARVKKNQ